MSCISWTKRKRIVKAFFLNCSCRSFLLPTGKTLYSPVFGKFLYFKCRRCRFYRVQKHEYFRISSIWMCVFPENGFFQLTFLMSILSKNFLIIKLFRIKKRYFYLFGRHCSLPPMGSLVPINLSRVSSKQIVWKKWLHVQHCGSDRGS